MLGFQGEDMLTRRVWLPIAILLALGGCRDAAGPAVEQDGAGFQLGARRQVVSGSASSPHMNILEQSSTAPPLETYQASFWARHDRQSTVAVNYHPAAGQSVGEPFLFFYIPKFGLKFGPDGVRLSGRDSVFITITIDPVNLSVDFQPSGVSFSRVFSAELAISYANANPDLNGDGLVDATDERLERHLALWGQTAKMRGWFKLSSENDTKTKYLASNLYHFSEYAVAW
jgi:hypothetical protein